MKAPPMKEFWREIQIITQRCEHVFFDKGTLKLLYNRYSMIAFTVHTTLIGSYFAPDPICTI